MNKRLYIVFLLGFSSGLPLALVTSTLQAWFADMGMSVLTTSALSLVGLPYAYRILWGPLLDSYSLFSLGKRRSWILTMQLGLLLGFNIMPYFSPIYFPQYLAALAFLLACFSATQDAVIDAHRIEYLPIKLHGVGASLAVLGYRIALLTTGGVALVLASHAGWVITYHCMGSLMLIGLFAVVFSKEPTKKESVKTSFLMAVVLPMKDIFQRPGITSLLLFILFYKLGEAFTTTTSGIVMPFLIHGMGFSLDVIGYVNKVLGIGAIILGGLAAGFFLLRCSLYKALFIFGLLQAVTNLLFVALAMVGNNITLLAVAVGFDNFAAGMGSTALVAFFMRLVNEEYTATQFSLLVAIAMLPRIFSGPVAGLLQMWLGWVGLYQLSFILALGFIPFLIRIKAFTKAAPEEILTEVLD